MLAGLVLTACGSTELLGFVRTPLPDVGDQTLPDASNGGVAFEMKAAEEGLLLVYFGYTNCPDVCPTSLADIRQALEKLGNKADRVDLAMATVDPDRDTDEVVTGYVQTFVADAHGLRTEDDAELRSVADAFGADYGVTVDEEGQVEVSHTAHIYVVDADGMLRVTWPFGMESEDMARDMKTLLRSA